MAVNKEIPETKFTEVLKGEQAKAVHLTELRAAIDALQNYAANVDNCGNCTGCQSCQGCQICQRSECECDCNCGDDST